METENMKEKILCDFGISLSHLEVNLKQLSEKLMSVKINVLKKHLFPNSTMAFADILRNI